MKAILETTEELLTEARKIVKPSPFVSSLIAALGAVKDNATWEIERQEKQKTEDEGQKTGVKGQKPQAA